jgi:hypothetical protein
VCGATFLEDDHRGLWLALQTAAEHDLARGDAARLCCTAMKRIGCWWAEGPHDARTPLWSVESIALLFGSYPADTAAVEPIAREFVASSARWRRVIRCAKLLERAVNHAVDGLHPRQFKNVTVTDLPAAAEGRAA